MYRVQSLDYVGLFIIDVSRNLVWVENMGCPHSYL